MTWFDRHPEDLAEQSEPAEALAALRQQQQLSPSEMATLDLYLNHWVLAVLLRPADREGILEVQQLCGLARTIAARSTEERAEVERLITRWRAFGDLLEGKRYALQTQATQAPIKLLHEDQILRFISQAPRIQSELLAELKLSAGRVSQLLGTLEAQGKLVRQRKGKESWVSLPAVAAHSVAPPVPQETSARAVATYFARRQAA